MTLTLTPSEERKVVSDRRRKARLAEAKASRPKVHRPVAKDQRQPRKKDPAYLQFIRTLPCAVSHLGGCSGRVEAAHVRFSDAKAGKTNPGMQAKPDDRPWSLPCCAGHHRDGPQAQHAAGERAWWEGVGIDPIAVCQALSAAYDAPEPHAAAVRIIQSSRPIPNGASNDRK